MKDYKPIFEKLFKNQLSTSEFKTLLINLETIIEKTFKKLFDKSVENLFAKYYGSDYIEVLSQELLLKLIHQKNIILNLVFIHENYLISIAKNLINYHLSSKFKIIKKEINFEDLYLSKDPDEQEELKLGENLPKVMVDYLENLRLFHMVEILKKHLTPKEIEVLCCYILKYVYKQEKRCKINKNVLYKRWERLKPKLRKILGYEIFEENSPHKFFEIIKSELC
uniref:Uncharacterized protein n=1 Tax=Thermodesulfobacterium geofontis TaxID=1295609 RepID=A0A7C4JQM5_9BACT